MEIGLIEQPAEPGKYRVQVDGNIIRGFIQSVTRQTTTLWTVHYQSGTAMRVRPSSREAAAALLAFHHFEAERKQIIAKRKEDSGDS